MLSGKKIAQQNETLDAWKQKDWMRMKLIWIENDAEEC
jgi:hypothetical protein